MTSEQKEQALIMRADGQTYASIAEALGVPVGSVKSYVSRNTVGCLQPKTTTDNVSATVESDSTSAAPTSPDNSVSSSAFCRQCGEPLNMTSKTHMRRFCSESCRQKWWRAHKGEVSVKASVSVCVGCGASFKNGGNPARRFCSQACYFNYRFGIRRDCE